MSFRSVLSHAGFRRLWASQGISRLGDSIHEIALIWIVYEVTGDPALMSLVVVASLLPLALTSLPAGVFVDRWDRKRVLVGTTFLHGIAVLCIPLVGQRYPEYLVPTVLGVAFVTGLLQAFFNPTRTAVVPKLVPEDELDSANALTEMTKSLSKAFYALGGFLVAFFGSYFAFYADAATFFVAGALLVTLPDSIRHQNDDNDDSGFENVYSDMKAGLEVIYESRVIQSLILVSVLTGFALGPLTVILPVFATQVLQASSATFGYLYASIYVGALLGSIVVSEYEASMPTARAKFVVAGILGMGAALFSLILLHQSSVFAVGLCLLSLVVFGVCFAAVQIPARSLAQSLVPDDVQGRVFSIWTAVGLVSAPASVAIVGIALTRVSVLDVVLVQGLVMAITGLVFGLATLSSVGQSIEQEAIEAVANRDAGD